MFGSAAQTPLDRSAQPSPRLDAQLPRGECSFILSEGESNLAGAATPQRCSCRGFYADQVVRSRCGCGHQAWHHEAQPANGVPLEEHLEVVEEVKRLRAEFAEKCAVLERELTGERTLRLRAEHVREEQQALVYQNMTQMALKLDDKIEAVVDKSQDTHDMLLRLQEKVVTVEDLAMELETRVDGLDRRGLSAGSSKSRSLTPVAERPGDTAPAGAFSTTAQLPIRTERRPSPRWSCRLIVAPSKSQRYAYEHDSAGFRRLKSRGLVQEVTFSDRSAEAFVGCVEGAFRWAFRGRPWMPLTGYRPRDEPFGRIVLQTLAAEHLTADTWDHALIDRHCVIHDKFQGDLLYVALQNEDLTWAEIKFLPAGAFGAGGNEDGCWAHDEDLDGRVPGFKSLDQALAYDYAEPLPPYSSRTVSMITDHRPNSILIDRPSSKLDVLASASAAYLRNNNNNNNSNNNNNNNNGGHIGRGMTSPQAGAVGSSSSTPPPGQVGRQQGQHHASLLAAALQSPTRAAPPSVRSVPSISDRSFSDRSSLAGDEHMMEEWDEQQQQHRIKKLRTKASMPAAVGGGPMSSAVSSTSSGSGGGATAGSAPTTQVYVSGRSKRKLQVREGKVKEPVRFTEWRPINSINSFRHRNDKGKGQAGQQPSPQPPS